MLHPVMQNEMAIFDIPPFYSYMCTIANVYAHVITPNQTQENPQKQWGNHVFTGTLLPTH